MAIATALLIFLLASPAAYAATQHVVGGSSGWSNVGTDYSAWAGGQTFTVGDSLLFNYDSTHKVAVVTQTDYSSCSSSNALQTYSDGSTSIPLPTAGSMYFICPTAGHCSQGMKLAVTVVAASTTPGTAPSTTPGTPSTTPATTSSPPPPAKNGAASMNNLMVGSLAALGTIVALMG